MSLRRSHIVLTMLVLLAGLSVGPAGTAAAGVLAVRGDDAYPPYEYLDEQGRPTGFNVELLREVLAVAGLEGDIRLVSWSEARADLEEGRADIITGMVPTPERKARLDFSIPHGMLRFSLFVRHGTSLHSLADMAGKEVLLEERDVMHDTLLEQAVPARIVPVRNPVEAMRLLAEGRYDCVLVDQLTGLYQQSRLKLDNVVMVGAPAMAFDYCFGVRKGDWQLLAKLNQGLAVLFRNGRYDALYSKWFKVYQEKTLAERLARFTLWAAGPLALLLALALGVSWLLRRQVAARTVELREELAERLRTEEELRQAKEEAEASSRAKTMMLTSVSHELKTPLTAILGFAKLAAKKLKNSVLPAAQREDPHCVAGLEQAIGNLDILSAECVRIKKILDEILFFSDLEAGTLAWSIGPVDLARLTEQAVDASRSAIEGKGLKLNLDLAPGLPMIAGDEARLSLVIEHLLVNAGKYTEHGSVSCSVRREGDKLLVRVADTGRGVPPADREAIFRPFLQGGDILTGKPGGLGLGLSICRAIVQRHGGWIWVDGATGRGSVFSISLPIAEPGADKGVTPAGREG